MRNILPDRDGLVNPPPLPHAAGDKGALYREQPRTAADNHGRGNQLPPLLAISKETTSKDPTTMIGAAATYGQHRIIGDPKNTEAPLVLPSNYTLPQAWATYLENVGNWSLYGHFTFKGSPHPEAACKAYDFFVHKINRKLFGQNYWKHKQKGITWARGTELQGRGSVHFHSIMGNIALGFTTERFREDLMGMWDNIGGISRIYPYVENNGAEFYMSKSAYAWKRGEIDLSANLPQMTLTL